MTDDTAASDGSPERELRPARERARFVAACYVTAFRVVRVLAASAAAVTTLALLTLVQRLVATPTVEFAGATIPLTQVVAGAVLAVLVKRLYDLNVADDGEQ